MLGKLFVLFVVVPLVDLYLLITIGGLIGGGPTLAFVLLSGLVGVTLARRQGLRVWRDWQESVARGQMPREGLTSSLLVLVGGVLLVVPGVITDIAGLTLLVPPARRMIARWVANWAQARLDVHTIGPELGPAAQRFRGEIIDVDARESE